MAHKVQCGSCGATYQKLDAGEVGLYYVHACPTELIDAHAVCDEKGNVVRPATFKPTPNPRNENLKPHPEKPNEFVLVSEGSGVTEIE